jgi:hypothetical protein
MIELVRIASNLVAVFVIIISVVAIFVDTVVVVCTYKSFVSFGFEDDES